MKHFTLSSTFQESHPIFVGEINNNLIAELLKDFVKESKKPRHGLVVDSKVFDLWQEKLYKNFEPDFVIKINAIEAHKNLELVTFIWRALLKHQVDRATVLFLVGGGVMGDLAGFAAATFKRGIPFIHVPTTLISQVDSSIGGKTGFNFEHGKNIVGTFTQPQAVVIDPRFLQTLSLPDLYSGMAECFKHGLIADEAYYNTLVEKPISSFDEKKLRTIIEDSVRLKISLIQTDLKQFGQRQKVLFGHTLGQAIEAVSLQTSNPLTHGEAIALGMVAEMWLSQKYGTIAAPELVKLENALKQNYLPTRTLLPESDILLKLTLDKKTRHQTLYWTLLEQVGKAKINQVVEPQDIIKALAYLRNA